MGSHTTSCNMAHNVTCALSRMATFLASSKFSQSFDKQITIQRLTVGSGSFVFRIKHELEKKKEKNKKQNKKIVGRGFEYLL